MKVKVREASGPVLDWLVAKCEGLLETSRVVIDMDFWVDRRPFVRLNPTPQVYYEPGYEPSTNWAQGGPIIEREKLDGFWNPEIEMWSFAGWDERGKREVIQRHENFLVAAMRCYVASKLGDEVEVPDELSP